MEVNQAKNKQTKILKSADETKKTRFDLPVV